MKLAINAQQQKLRRRTTKISALQKKIADMASTCPTGTADTTKLRRYEFELKQAEEDKTHLEEDIQTLNDVYNTKKEN